MADLSEISKRLFRQLDSSGYSMKMIDIRRKHWRQRAAAMGIERKKKVVIAGSKGEGLSKWLESDTDILCFIPDYICIHELENMQNIPEQTSVFLAVNTSPGYCLLELVKSGTNIGVDISNCLVPFNDKIYMSSELIMATIKLLDPGEGVVNREITGPAATGTFDDGLMQDLINTFSCECNHILLTWALRARLHDWPPLTVRQNVPKMSGNLVATGRKGSPTCHLEWRYCFNEVELLLTETLNDTQKKLYKMLKIINNYILKPLGFSLSSYMMKNVVYWVAEFRPQATFVPEMLFQWVIKSLKMLEHAADTNKLPYYMIPERNLFTEKVKETDRLPLKAKITEIIESGPAFLLKCKTLHRVMSLTPLELCTMQQKMECVEMAYIYMVSRDATQKASNPLWNEYKDELQECLDPILRYGWPESVQREILACQNCLEAIKMLLG